MTIAKRRRIFYALFAAFFVIGSAAILYVSGWRFDFTTFKAGRVGGIFISSFPKDVEIRLDGKPVKNQSGLFGSGTLINDLFPKSYALKLSADGYNDWQENAAVAPSLVAEMKYAVLVPKNPASLTTIATAKNFWLFGDNLLLQNGGDALYLGGKKLGAGALAGETNDFGYLLVKADSGTYFWNTSDGSSRLNINSLLKKSGFNVRKNFEIAADPYDKNHLLILEQSKISLLDLDQNKIFPVYVARDGVLGEKLAASQFFLSWTKFNAESGISTIFIYDKFLGKIKSATDLPGKNSDIRWLQNKNLALLQNGGGLYLYDRASDDLRKIADDVKNFEFTGDGSAVAALEHSALEVISLDGSNYHRFNLPQMENVKGVAWYADDNHLFVSYPDYVSFLDLADGSLKNFQNVAASAVSHYDANNNRLYFLEGGAMFYLNFPK